MKKFIFLNFKKSLVLTSDTGVKKEISIFFLFRIIEIIHYLNIISLAKIHESKATSSLDIFSQYISGDFLIYSRLECFFPSIFFF